MNHLYLATLVTFAASCTSGPGNTSGNHEAAPGGDTSNPAKRGSPVEDVRAACGSDGALTAAGTIITRQPYLQQVTPTSAIVGWVTSNPDGQRVVFTHPDGKKVMEAGGTVDEKALRVGNARQMWSQASGLEPNTIYCYGLSGSGDMTSRVGFRTAPADDSNGPVRFLVFGDSGGGSNGFTDQFALLDQMSTVPYELMFHTGDIAYDNGSMAEFEDNVFSVYAELFRHIPFFPAPGNHEYRATADAAPFRSVFSLPGGTGDTWYSYDWGQVHLASLDTEADYDTQIAWLDQDLATSNKPWKIVYLHRPPYSSGAHGSDTNLQTKLAPVLKKHGVQVVFAGHDHNYERMIPQDGVAYIVTGGGGRGTRPVGTSSFTAYSSAVIHFVYGEINGDEMTLHAIDATGKEFDSQVITR
ncbi:MAG: metallophosphoesterase family protein [Deltaproteobacteria bacterium]|nr:metallophosphoesterase family protein [Deltaproteobacteria bacterium]